jgi:hypothetical protein
MGHPCCTCVDGTVSPGHCHVPDLSMDKRIWNGVFQFCLFGFLEVAFYAGFLNFGNGECSSFVYFIFF